MSLDVNDFYTPIEFLRDNGGKEYNKRESSPKGQDALNAFKAVCEEVYNRAQIPQSAIMDPDNAWLDGTNKKYRQWFWLRIKPSIYRDFAVSISIFADQSREDTAKSDDSSEVYKYKQGYRVELDIYENIIDKHREVNQEHKKRLLRIAEELKTEYEFLTKSTYEFGVALRKSFAISDSSITSKDQNTYKETIKQIVECVEKLYSVLENNVYVFNSVIGSQLQELVLKNNKQIILTGAPGTGKTYSAREFAIVDLGMQYDNLAEDDKKSITRDDWIKKRYQMVQFHPSYDYTDFVEGLRPVQDGNNTTFKRMDGSFKEFCRKIQEEGDNGNRYFIIDEINRADLSKVFGELMFCLEKNYRGKDNCIPTQYKNLPAYEIEYQNDDFEMDDTQGEKMRSNKVVIRCIDPDCFDDGFFIPNNVVIIGTMNEIDRSVDTFDYALRRRFKWVNVKVDDELVLTTFEQMIRNSNGEYKLSGDDIKRYTSQIGEMNAVLTRKEYSRIFRSPEDYFVGPSYFEELLDEKELPEIWENSVKPLLIEYVRGRDVADEFIDSCESSLLSGVSEARYALMDKSRRVNLSCKYWPYDKRVTYVEVVMSLLNVVLKHVELFKQNAISKSNIYKVDKLLSERIGEEGRFNSLFNDEEDWETKSLKTYQKLYIKGADEDVKRVFVNDWNKAIEEWKDKYS